MSFQGRYPYQSSPPEPTVTDKGVSESPQPRPIEYPSLPYKEDHTRHYNPYAPSSEGNRSRRGSPDFPTLDQAALVSLIVQADKLHECGDAHDAFDIDKILLFRDNLDIEYEIRAFARTISFLLAHDRSDMA